MTQNPDANIKLAGPLGKLSTREPLTHSLLNGLGQLDGVEALVQITRYSAYFTVAELHDPTEVAKRMAEWIVEHLAEQQQVQDTLDQVARDSEKI